MNPVQQQRLSRFVDREGEMRSFCRMLDEPDCPRPVIMVWGEGGMGKSALLLRMMHEVSLRRLLKAEIIWTDTRNPDYLTVMRMMRDDIGANSFSEFTQLINFFTNPNTPQRVEFLVDAKGSINVGQGLQVAPSGKIDTVAGVVIRDLMLMVPRSDLGISDTDRMARLTDQFIHDLNAVAAQKKIVVFLDAVDKASDATKSWIWGELLNALREGRLANVNFVIGGRAQPPNDEVWQQLIDEKQLAPLKKEHIVEYLVKRNVDPGEAARDAVADWILVMSGGNPLKIANAVEMMSRKFPQDRAQ